MALMVCGLAIAAGNGRYAAAMDERRAEPERPGAAPHAPLDDAAVPRAPLRALRASDADRERVVALLRDGAADGRLTLGELTERSEHAYRARTLGDLETVIGDLAPGASVDAALAAPLAPCRPRSWFVALMGGSSRRGRWRVGRRVRAVAVMGGVEVDLRRAEFESAELDVTAVAVLGGVDVCVPEGVEVELSGFMLMGGKDARIDGHARPGAPVVRVRAFGLLCGVDVHTPRHPRPADPDTAGGADQSDRDAA